MKIIINCDDLGVSDEVNDIIFALCRQRRVTSASLLMNAPAVESAVAQLSNYPKASFGVHLNLTQFLPLTTHPGLVPLLDENGALSENAKRTQMTSEVREAVFEEWCAQVERAVALGVPVSHLDSHHHIHTLPGLFGVLKRVQRRFGIRKVRLTQNVIGSCESIPASKSASKALWNFMLRHFYCTKTTDGFTSFSTFYERLQSGLNWQGSIELMCHPGHKHFQAETELLRGPWKEQLGRNVQLISYNEL